MENLRPVFAGAEPVFAAETPGALALFAERGLEPLSLDALVARRPTDVVLFMEDIATMRRRNAELREATADSRVLLVPVCSFDPSHDVLAYTLDVLAASDFERAVARSRVWREVLMRRPSPLEFRRPDAPDCRFLCHLLGDLKVQATVELELPRGRWRGPANFFEVEMEVFDSVAHYFSLDGELPVDGMLTAKSSNIPPELEPLHAEMNETIRALGGRAGTLVVRDNRIEQLVLGDEDLTAHVLKVSGGSYDGNLLEFAIGTNSPACAVDWSRNSVLNEGVAGIHVAVGDGQSGAHVDFVSAGTRLVA